jgi:hypothetical protein
MDETILVLFLTTLLEYDVNVGRWQLLSCYQTRKKK